ncbi:MAG: aspartyl-tRNA amidotransferase [Omnitrophica bacterium GWA2_52_8]|nr:MAG: aspartyl-tRNA amidotransferase [Omnitrophica bacterium GWA2_52_8]
MSMESAIDSDIQSAMKSKDSNKLNTLRLLKAAIVNFKIDKKKEKLDDADIIQLLQKQVKQHRESIDSFEKAGRTDLIDKEKQQLAVLLPYMPAQLTADEVRSLVREIILKTGAKSKADSGSVMKELMPKVKGKADGKLVSQIVNEILV